MSKKSKVFALCAATAVAASGFTVAACQEPIPVHEHTLFPKAATEATCVTNGTLAYDECLYCNKIFVNGKEMTAEELVTPFDPEKHLHMSHVDGYPTQCSIDGLKDYDECDDCHAVYIDGIRSELADTVIKSSGSHNYGSGYECAECGSLRILGEGNNIDLDGSVGYAVTAVKDEKLNAGYPGNTGGGNSPEKTAHLAYYPAHRMEFSTQYSNANQNFSSLDGAWVIENTSAASGHSNSFTRFAYGKAGTSEAYIGRFFMSYDYTVTFDKTAPTVNRIGVNVTDATATTVQKDQSKLLGLDAAADGKTYALESGKTYNFTYVMEITDETQLVQIFNCVVGVHKAVISNMYFVNIDGATGTEGARLLYFGAADAENRFYAKETCSHEYKYELAEKEATCLQDGYKAHEHCPACGVDFVNGAPSDDIDLPKVDHDYGELVEAADSTCSVKGHDAYYHCGWCDTYFSGDENKTALPALPEKELIDHESGEWQSDEKGHWKVCGLCNERIESAAHIPGPDATETTDQTCTECGYILTLAENHVHEIVKTEAKDATATENGHIEHYTCTKCKKKFSDEKGEHEITDVAVVYKADAIEQCGDNWNGITGAITNMGDDGLLKNPGKWAAQTQTTGVKATIADGVLRVELASAPKDKVNKSFIRFKPANEDGSAYIGTYIWSFDFEVEADTSLYVGYFVQYDDGKNFSPSIAIADVVKEFKAGTKYRFSVRVELTAENEYAQLNVRNVASKGGIVKLSNASVVYYPEAVNTGAHRLESIDFATPIETPVAEQASFIPEAILPKQ